MWGVISVKYPNKYAPYVAIVVSIGLSCLYCVLPYSFGLGALFFLAQGVVYSINCWYAGQRGLKNVNLMGNTLIVLNLIAAWKGWIGWFHAIFHLVATLVCDSVKMDEADPRWSKEEQERYLRERHRRVM